MATPKLHISTTVALPFDFVTSTQAILDVLLDAYPDSVTLDDLADRIGASPTSSSFANRRSALKSLGLAECPASGRVRASSLLFPEGLS